MDCGRLCGGGTSSRSSERGAGAASEWTTSSCLKRSTGQPTSVRLSDGVRTMQDDTIYIISTAKSRFDTDYSVERLTWEELSDRLSKSVETAETLEEYNRMLPDERGAIKDVGGFVGGEVRPDPSGKRRRVRGSVQERQLLTLDIDHATAKGFFAWWEGVWRYRSLYYSTHSSQQYYARLRLVVPLSRPVTAVEYEAIGRMVCKPFITDVDESTYQMERLMYYPSHPSDEPPLYELREGAVLDVDELLELMGEQATNPGAWAYATPEARQARLDAKDFEGNLPDPRSKRGIIGAWCRAYSVTAVMDTLLSDVYARAGKRYRYLKGNGAPGVTVSQDEQYIYSHHSDDPAANRHAVNSYDLVRIHRYGHLDSTDDKRQRSTTRPSYTAMAEYAMSDERVRSELAEEQARDLDAFDVEEDGAPFSSTPERVEELVDERKRILEMIPEGAITKTGDIVCDATTLGIILSSDSRLEPIRNDQFANRWIVTGTLPWERNATTSEQWADSDDAGLRDYLTRSWHLKGVTKDKVADAITVELNRKDRQVHPIRDYLDALEWDGTERLDTLMEVIFGVPAKPIYRAMVRKTLTAAVARIYDPGVKFDQILVFRGAQGIGKSTLLKVLSRGYYNESLSFDAAPKDLMEQLRNKWLVEFSELEGLSRADASTFKSFLSRQTDTYRPSYGRHTVDYPRQCVFFGSTNEDQFLRDATGNRRFWVLPCTRTKAQGWSPRLTELYRDPSGIDQVWAEARERYLAGEELYLDSSMVAEMAVDQEDYELEDPAIGVIAEFLDRPILYPVDWDKLDPDDRREWLSSHVAPEMQPNLPTTLRRTITTVEILNECYGNRRWREDIRYKSQQLGNLMDKICEAGGWRRTDKRWRFAHYGRQRYWERVQDE